MSQISARILVVDDEPDKAESVERILRRAGFETTVTTQSRRAAAMVEKKRPDLVITDLEMPDLDGVGLLEQLKESHPEIPVILATAFGSVDSAVDAMKRGASDYLSRPFSPGELLLRVERVLAWMKMEEENRILRKHAAREDKYRDIIGESNPLRDILRVVEKVSSTEARVLIVGESGTGKELLARTIHRRSERRHRPFFSISCGALPENLLESALFYDERSSCTTTEAPKKGLFEATDGGTLFLDGIGETNRSFQTKLLRVLQEEELMRAGGTFPSKSDVRLISATNRDLRGSIANGDLRKDLFYRLSVVQITLPALRDRVDDIPALVNHFIEIYARQIKKKIRGVHRDAMKALRKHRWPGNIRELENVIERAVIMANSDIIRLQNLPSGLTIQPAEKIENREPMNEPKRAERELLLRTLRECGWNRSAAAKKLGIGRRTLYDKVARLGISLRPT